MKLKLVEIAFFLSLFICIFSCLSFENDCKGIRKEIMRLHVIANSDSEADQTLKLDVRDSILEKSKELFGTQNNISDATEILKSKKQALIKTADEVIKKAGYNYKARVEIAESYFPTRQYDSVTLPAGYYKSVRVILGEGKGKNWWCVLFPPMCLPAAAKGEINLNDVLTQSQMKLVKSDPRFEVRFWIVEKLQNLKRSHKQKP